MRCGYKLCGELDRARTFAGLMLMYAYVLWRDWLRVDDNSAALAFIGISHKGSDDNGTMKMPAASRKRDNN
jgi:hypothetical protein